MPKRIILDSAYLARIKKKMTPLPRPFPHWCGEKSLVNIVNAERLINLKT